MLSNLLPALLLATAPLTQLQQAQDTPALIEAVEALQAEHNPLAANIKTLVAVEVEAKLVKKLDTKDPSAFVAAGRDLVTFLHAKGNAIPTAHKNAFVRTLTERAGLLVDRAHNAKQPEAFLLAARNLAEFMDYAEGTIPNRKAEDFGFTLFAEARSKLVRPVKNAKDGNALLVAAGNLVDFMVAMGEALAPPVVRRFLSVLEAQKNSTLLADDQRAAYLERIKPLFQKKQPSTQ